MTSSMQCKFEEKHNQSILESSEVEKYQLQFEDMLDAIRDILPERQGPDFIEIARLGGRRVNSCSLTLVLYTD